MIEPVFLAHLRQHHRAEMVLVMVLPEQLAKKKPRRKRQEVAA